MVKFHFRVKRAFLQYRTHPITVKRAAVKTAAESFPGLLDEGDIIVVFPRGEREPGKVYPYSGRRRAPFHQVWAVYKAKFPDYLKLGDELIVVLFVDDGDRYAVLEYAE